MRPRVLNGGAVQTRGKILSHALHCTSRHVLCIMRAAISMAEHSSYLGQPTFLCIYYAYTRLKSLPPPFTHTERSGVARELQQVLNELVSKQPVDPLAHLAKQYPHLKQED